MRLQSHILAGVTVAARQATKAFGNKRATLVAEVLAQALLSSEVLAQRSVGGASAPMNKGPDLALKPPLSQKWTQLKVTYIHR